AIDKPDIGAYMALIDPSDPVFATEQRAWIADLQMHPVEDVEIDIAWNEPVRLQEDGSAIAPIEITWHIVGEELDRHFAYQALFAPVGAPNGQWIFAGRAWDVLDNDTPGVRVYSDAVHEDLAHLAADRVEYLRDVIAENMGFDYSQTKPKEVVVKIYPDMSSLQASIYLSYTDHLSGWNEPGESIKILGRDDFTVDLLDPLLAHEIGHAVSFEFGPEINNAPWWTLEGIAEVAAGLFRDSWESKNNRMVHLAKADDLRDWSLLADFRGEANNHAMYVYLQGWSMIDYIDRVHGLDQRNAWFKSLAVGSTLDEATQAVMGISFDQLDQEWRTSLLNWDSTSTDD
ncbi:MAG: peptidase MA family metallohydrolase, partial [Phycisphaerales bacterium]